jgi:hypothetical protein
MKWREALMPIAWPAAAVFMLTGILGFATRGTEDRAARTGREQPPGPTGVAGVRECDPAEILVVSVEDFAGSAPDAVSIFPGADVRPPTPRETSALTALAESLTAMPAPLDAIVILPDPGPAQADLVRRLKDWTSRLWVVIGNQSAWPRTQSIVDAVGGTRAVVVGDDWAKAQQWASTTFPCLSG